MSERKSGIRYIQRPFEVKEISESGKFSGYGSVFGVLDSYADIVVKGAFTKTIARHQQAKSAPAMLWQHKSDDPIGVWTNVHEDDHGLYVEGELILEASRGRDAYWLMKKGAVRGLSIGYKTVKDQYDHNTDVRQLLEVDLWEVSPVTFPACPTAQIGDIKSITERDFERMLTRDAGLTRSQARVVINQGFKALKTTQDAGLGELSAAIEEVRRIFKPTQE